MCRMAFASPQLLGKRKSPEDSADEDTVLGYPLHVGKAVKDEKKIKQPEAAEIGLVPEVAFRWMFSGPSNSGKTNLARWILDKYYQKQDGKSFFDRIYLFSPTAKLDPVWKDLEGLRASDRITELDKGGKEKLFSIFNTSISRAKATGKDKAPHTLVIIDDGIADQQFMNSREFMKVFIAGRHGNISIMILTQSYSKVPRTPRMQLTALSMFPSKTTEIERLQIEHGPLTLGKWDFIDMVKYATRKTDQDKYPFFFLDTNKPEECRFRKGLHEILEPKDMAGNDETNQDAKAAYSQEEGHEDASACIPRQPNKKRPHEQSLSSQADSRQRSQRLRRRER